MKYVNKDLSFLKEVKLILKSMKIKYRLNWKSKSSYALPRDSFIHVGAKETTLENFLSTVFHEIAHVLNFRDKKYFIYHNVGHKSVEDKKFKDNFNKVALKAERYTDKKACKLMKEYYPNVKFIPSYRSKEEVELIRRKCVG